MTRNLSFLTRRSRPDALYTLARARPTRHLPVLARILDRMEFGDVRTRALCPMLLADLPGNRITHLEG